MTKETSDEDLTIFTAEFVKGPVIELEDPPKKDELTYGQLWYYFLSELMNEETKNADTYKCAVCRETFKKGWSDEEALEELENNWGIDPEECDLVCDDCHKDFMEWMKRND